MSDLAGACVCSYGVSIFTEPTGEVSTPKEDGDDRNSSKMSIILVEGVCFVFLPFLYIIS
jgi:hypothetical protein